MNQIKCLLLSVRADVGGGPEHMRLLLDGLAGRYDFIVAAPEGQAYSRRFSQSAELLDLPFRRFSVLAFLRLVAFVRRQRVDLIHSHGKGAGIYGRLLGWMTGRPVIHTFHGFHYRHLSRLKRFVYLTVERGLARRTTVLVNVSESERASCVAAGVVGSERAIVIPNGVVVPPTWTNPLTRPDRTGLVLINVARHEPEKGVDGVLRVARELDRLGVAFELWLIGDGEQHAELKAQAAADGLTDKVRFLGFRDDVPQLLQHADIFVSASHGEGMPLTLLEAMGAGLPSIASDVIGNRDVVEDGETGFLYPLDAPEVAAARIAQLANDPGAFAVCSRTAHARALALYSMEMMCKRIADVYDSVTMNKTGNQ